MIYKYEDWTIIPETKQLCAVLRYKNRDIAWRKDVASCKRYAKKYELGGERVRWEKIQKAQP